MSTRDAALELLRAWHAVQPWARVDPRHLEVGEVKNVGPVEVLLRSEHEVRGVEYQLVPAARRDLSPPRTPDPWAFPLALPHDATVGASVRAPVEGHPVALDCTGCSGSGELKCHHCDGTGRIQGGRHSYTCPTCGGRMVLRCADCRGSGGMLGTPTVWARIDAVEARRTADDATLPTEVVVDLAERRVASELVWRREAVAIDRTMLDPALGEATLALAVDLLASATPPARAETRRQMLEVRRMAVFEIRRVAGPTLWIWGEPPTVHPKSALASPLGRVLPFLAR